MASHDNHPKSASNGTGHHDPSTATHASQSPVPSSIEHAMGSRNVVATPGLFSEMASVCPIGAFDSGMGGLSIVAEMRRAMPHEDIIYFADSANCPYGGRTDAWLRNRSLEIGNFLLTQGAKTIVVACNTASAAGLEHLRATYRVPVVGLVPAVKPAVEQTRSGIIGVLATPVALRGTLLSDVIERFATPAGVQVIREAPFGLVEAVEHGELDTDETRMAVEDAVLPLLEQGADEIVFGCTHYPFLGPLIREIAGDGVRLVDSGIGVALQTRRVLEANGIARRGGRHGSLIVYTSGDPDEVRPVVWRLVGEQVTVLSDRDAPRDIESSLVPLEAK